MDKDIAIIIFEKLKNLCTSQKFVFKEVLEHEKHSFHLALVLFRSGETWMNTAII